MLELIKMKSNLKDGWDAVWSAVKTGAPGLSELLLSVGVVLMVFALGKWLWDKRKGGGGNSSALLWTAVVGAALAGPEVIFPIMLGIVDWLINTVVGIVQ